MFGPYLRAVWFPLVHGGSEFMSGVSASIANLIRYSDDPKGVSGRPLFSSVPDLPDPYMNNIDSFSYVESFKANSVWQCTLRKEVAWNLLSLFIMSGMLCLEVNLVAFLLQKNYISIVESLTRTFIVSGIIFSVDILLKAIYVFGFGVSLFINGTRSASANRVKWGLLIVNETLRFWNAFPSPKSQNTESEIGASSYGRSIIQ